MTRPFGYQTRVFVADTNCFGTVSFARYFEWQGRAREAFFRAVVPNFQQLVEQGYRLLTVEASMAYYREAQVSDPLTIEIHLLKLRASSVELSLTFQRGRAEIIGLGYQRLVVANRHGTPTKLPQEIRRRLQDYDARSRQQPAA